jgi:hypothetical protein
LKKLIIRENFSQHPIKIYVNNPQSITPCRKNVTHNYTLQKKKMLHILIVRKNFFQHPL